MQIELHVEGSIERLRRFADELQAALGDEATVSGWLGTADPDDEPKSGTIYVDVFKAANEAEALKHAQPAIRRADPGLTVVKGGTTAMEYFAPMPQPPSQEPVDKDRSD